MVNVAVMGAGSWGTTLAKVFADAGNDVRLWARRAELAQAINETHTNPDYLPDTRLPAAVRATHNDAEALALADVVVFGVPSQTLRANVEKWAPHLPEDATLVSISKGVETTTLQRMSEVIVDAAGVPADRVAVLSGPNLAKEIAAGQVAATVIACSDEDRAQRVQAAVAAPYLRPYTNTDVIGAEIGGACKNVIALACGIASGKGWAITPWPPSSPAVWRKLPAWAWSWGRIHLLSPASQAWATWWQRAPRHCRAIAPSATAWAKAARLKRPRPRPMDRSPKASTPVTPSTASPIRPG